MRADIDKIIRYLMEAGTEIAKNEGCRKKKKTEILAVFKSIKDNDRKEILDLLSKDDSDIQLRTFSRQLDGNARTGMQWLIDVLSDDGDEGYIKIVLVRVVELLDQTKFTDKSDGSNGGPTFEQANAAMKQLSEDMIKISKIVEETQKNAEKAAKDSAIAAKRVDSVEKRATDAEKKAEASVKKADDAATKATTFLGRVDAATERAATAVKKADDAVKKADDAVEKADDAVGKVKGATDAAENATNIANGLLPNVLAVVGIFVAIVIAIVACYLSFILTQNNGITVVVQSQCIPIMRCVVLGHMVINTVFFLTYMVSKISGRSASSLCQYQTSEGCIECEKRKGSCSGKRKLWRKYPYIVVTNAMFVVAYALLGVAIFVDTYYRVWMINVSRAFPARFILGSLGATIVIAAFLILIFFWVFKEKNKE